MPTRTPTPEERLAQAASVASRAHSQVIKLRKKAGRALHSPETVNRELSEATDFFADSNWGNETLDEIRLAGQRIARLAEMLDSAKKVPTALVVWKEKSDELRDAREAAGR